MQGITAATNIDIADKIARLLYEKTSSIKKSEKDKGATEIMKVITEDNEIEKEIITNLVFRGEKILLPELASKISKIKEENSAWKNIPIFVVSNTAGDDKKHAYLNLGANKFYTKSNFRLDQIIDDVKATLEQK